MNRLSPLEIEELERDDRVLAYLELEKDPLFPYLSRAQRLHYLDFALNIGRAQAELYSGADAFDLARQFKVKVVIQKSPHIVAGVTLRAAYDPKNRSIELFQASLEQIQHGLSFLLPSFWTYEQTVALHLAHELFHYLEATQIQPVDRQLPPLTTGRLGPLRVSKSRVRRCREIAAHAFAKHLTGFPFLPNALDALMVSHQEATLSQFQSALRRAAQTVFVGLFWLAPNNCPTSPKASEAANSDLRNPAIIYHATTAWAEATFQPSTCRPSTDALHK